MPQWVTEYQQHMRQVVTTLQRYLKFKDRLGQLVITTNVNSLVHSYYFYAISNFAAMQL